MKRNLIPLLICLIFLGSCTDEFLDKKPEKSLTVPTNLSDYWALLDNSDIMQFTPALGAFSSDEYYMLDNNLSGQQAIVRNSYTWSKIIFDSPTNTDWQKMYQQVYYANCVIEGLDHLIGPDKNNHEEINRLKGSAQFIRAYAFFNLATTFAKPYTSAASQDLGIPIRTTPDLSLRSVRGSLQQTYDQILKDLRSAAYLAPPAVSANKARPGKAAAYGLLSRVFLSMRDYANAELYADSCLKSYSTLVHYKNVNASLNVPFNRDNAEVLYQSYLLNYLPFLSASNTLVSNDILSSYKDGDLRKSVFFRANSAGRLYFKGSYTAGPSYMFSGIATDEIYLNRAECRARRGAINDAMADLNLLMVNRWTVDAAGGTKYVNQTAATKEEAIRLILNERLKELLFRGTRWLDLRRLNQENGYETTLQRTVNNVVYTLVPNSPRYVFPIPDKEISISGLEQNER